MDKMKLIPIAWACGCLYVVLAVDPLAGAILSIDALLIGFLDRIL